MDRASEIIWVVADELEEAKSFMLIKKLCHVDTLVGTLLKVAKKEATAPSSPNRRD